MFLFFKESVANLLELEINGNNHKDQAFIHFNNDATRGFDIASDARKLYGIEEAPSFSALQMDWNSPSMNFHFSTMRSLVSDLPAEIQETLC